jgi:hypothetical protein
MERLEAVCFLPLKESSLFAVFSGIRLVVEEKPVVEDDYGAPTDDSLDETKRLTGGRVKVAVDVNDGSPP